MPGCEKCWGDAYIRMRINPCKSQAEHYGDLINERKENPCTPEQQAGLDARVCPVCGRKTIHPILEECMNCGYDSSAKLDTIGGGE